MYHIKSLFPPAAASLFLLAAFNVTHLPEALSVCDKKQTGNESAANYTQLKTISDDTGI